MTMYYWKTKSWSTIPNHQEVSQSNLELWGNMVEKKNWRITELYNEYFQTEFYNTNSDFGEKNQWIPVTRRQTIEEAEAAIDDSISHYKKKIEMSNGPKVVKTFK